jgi:hypothetical protein
MEWLPIQPRSAWISRRDGFDRGIIEYCESPSVVEEKISNSKCGLTNVAGDVRPIGISFG